MKNERNALIKVENVLWEQISVIDLNHYRIAGKIDGTNFYQITTFEKQKY